jgi:predicted GIY-YIG superfamily endonuclease
MWIVYILKCADGKFYAGCTSNLTDCARRSSASERRRASPVRRKRNLQVFIGRASSGAARLLR